MGYEIEWSNLLTFCYNVYCAYIHRFEWTGLDWSTRSFVFIARWKKPMSIPDSNYKRHANDQNQNGFGMGMRMEMDLDTSQTDRWRFLVIYWNSIRFFFYLFTNSDSFSIARIAALKASITSRYYHIGFISHTLYLQKHFLFVLWNHFCKMLSLLRRIWFIFVVVAQYFQTKQNIQCYRRNIQSNMETKRNYIQYLFVIYWLCEFRERKERQVLQPRPVSWVFFPVLCLSPSNSSNAIDDCRNTIYSTLPLFCKIFSFCYNLPHIHLSSFWLLFFAYFYFEFFSVRVNIQSQQCKTLLKSALRCQNHGIKM